MRFKKTFNVRVEQPVSFCTSRNVLKIRLLILAGQCFLRGVSQASLATCLVFFLGIFFQTIQKINPGGDIFFLKFIS